MRCKYLRRWAKTETPGSHFLFHDACPGTQGTVLPLNSTY